jgi:hypothetical protein
VLQATAKAPFAVLLCAALAACSSGGSSSNSAPTFTELADEGTTLAGQIEALDYTDPSSLPTTGSAQYNGVMGLAVDGGETPDSVLLGELTMDVGFDQNAISGSVTNIVDRNNDRYEGQLALSNGVIDRTVDPTSAWTYGVDATGSVTDPTGTRWNVQADMLGDFFGPGYSHTGGDVFGDACSALNGCVSLDGVFGAKR